MPSSGTNPLTASVTFWTARPEYITGSAVRVKSPPHQVRPAFNAPPAVVFVLSAVRCAATVAYTKSMFDSVTARLAVWTAVVEPPATVKMSATKFTLPFRNVGTPVVVLKTPVLTGQITLNVASSISGVGAAVKVWSQTTVLPRRRRMRVTRCSPSSMPRLTFTRPRTWFGGTGTCCPRGPVAVIDWIATVAGTVGSGGGATVQVKFTTRASPAAT